MHAPLHSTTESQPDRRRWFALAVIVTAQFMVVLDVAIVNVALPTIKTDLGFSQENLQWVVTAYSIMFGGSCCWVAAWPTCSAGGACSWPGSRSSASARCSTGSPGRRAR
jgi:MFS family permease